MPEYLTRKQAADYCRERGIPVTAGTLQKKASTGGGPPYQIFGNKALYTRPAMDAWISEELSAPRRSTSEAE